VASTAYAPVEVLLVTNNVGDADAADKLLRIWPFKTLSYDGPFNWSAINNLAARHARGDYLLFLNDDVEATDKQWLDCIVASARRSGGGIAGPVLRYPNGSIQHAGLSLADDAVPCRHLFRFCTGDEGEAREFLAFDREVSAVTGACLLVSRPVFDALGGFDETLPLVCNDVDFCLRAGASGHASILAVGAELIHHEGISRSAMRESEDVRRFIDRWDWLLREGDPYYNPNLMVEGASWLVDPQVRSPLHARRNPILREAEAQASVGKREQPRP
jgi:GT2 family glycosyltransferase